MPLYWGHPFIYYVYIYIYLHPLWYSDLSSLTATQEKQFTELQLKLADSVQKFDVAVLQRFIARKQRDTAERQVCELQKKSDAAEKRIAYVDGQFSQALQKLATSENQHLAALNELGLERERKEAAEKELAELRKRLHAARHGAFWQYEMNGQWHNFSPEGNDQTHQAYLAYVQSAQSSTATIVAGGVERVVNFDTMTQTHSSTKKIRDIRVVAGVPREWVSSPAALLTQRGDLASVYIDVTDTDLINSVQHLLRNSGHAWDATTICSSMQNLGCCSGTSLKLLYGRNLVLLTTYTHYGNLL